MKKHYDLPEHIVDIIHSVMEENSIVYEVDAVKFIIQDYAAGLTVAEKTAEVIDEKFNKIFTRLRLGVRTAEQNSIVIKDALNTLLYEFPDIDCCMYTDNNKHKVIDESEEFLKEKIARYKQIKDNSIFEDEES